MPTISVIIPTWNRMTTIGQAVSSALSQSVEVLEVLVCDDGSTDQTREVVSALGDPRVRWIAGEHSGLPAVPRNRGIAAASGEWLAFLDSDDYWLPKKLELQINLSLHCSCQAVCCDALRMIDGALTEKPLLGLAVDSLAFADLLAINSIVCSSVLIRKKEILQAGGFPEAVSLLACEDYALWLRVATMTDFCVVAEPQLVYRDNPELSIRRNRVDPVAQKLSVINDFKVWGANRAARHYLQLASRKQTALRGGVVKSLLSALWGTIKRTPREGIAG